MRDAVGGSEMDAGVGESKSPLYAVVGALLGVAAVMSCPVYEIGARMGGTYDPGANVGYGLVMLFVVPISIALSVKGLHSSSRSLAHLGLAFGIAAVPVLIICQILSR